MAEPQNFSNHSKIVPLFHRGLFLLIFIVLVWSVRQLVTAFSLASAVQVVSAVALFLTAFFARVFAVKAQDRVIRAEERERMNRVLPDDLKGRLSELRLPQFVALRFASDGELADLVRRTLAGEFAKPTDIKRAVNNWRADDERV